MRGRADQLLPEVDAMDAKERKRADLSCRRRLVRPRGLIGNSGMDGDACWLPIDAVPVGVDACRTIPFILFSFQWKKLDVELRRMEGGDKRIRDRVAEMEKTFFR